MMRIHRSILGLLLPLAAQALMAGGPPYLTDDPVPVAHKALEGYIFSTMDRGPDGRLTLLPASEFNYGALPGLQLHLQAAFAWSTPGGAHTMSGWGDMEAGAKYRFIDEGEGHPQVSFYPQAELPTGNTDRGLGNGKAWYKLPLWAQKSWGPWTVCGGGGYAINHAPGARNYVFKGLQVERTFGEHLSIGAEVFAQAATEIQGRGSTIANVGGTWEWREGTSLLFSAGRSVGGERHTVAYLGIIRTWGAKS
jgi:hypothetical protein